MFEVVVLEIIEIVTSNFFNNQSLVEKVTGDWRPFISFTCWTGLCCRPTSSWKQSSPYCLSSKGGFHDLFQCEGCILPDANLSILKEILPLHLIQRRRLFQSEVLLTVDHPPQMFTQMCAYIYSGSGQLFLYHSDWLVLVRIAFCVCQHRDLLFQLCHDLGIIIK